jgi:hypothetical protein
MTLVAPPGRSLTRSLRKGIPRGPSGFEFFAPQSKLLGSKTLKCWELRANVNLAPFLRDTNCRDEAGTILSEIYHWFAEGFDTADLKDAKALLDELNQ